MKRALIALALAVASQAHAGQDCHDTPLPFSELKKGLDMALRTKNALDASGADVVLLARAGQDLSEYGLSWSHLGLAYKDLDASGAPVWRVLHKLNKCGTDKADIFRQGLGEFFMDRPYRYAGAFAVLAPQLQQALLPTLRSNDRATQMHSERYNMVAYPWALRYQQSNQFVAETLAAAAAPGQVLGRQQAQQWLKQAGYTPSELRISTLKRLGGRVARANVAFDDHPPELRFSNRINTTTADSVFAWSARTQLSAPVQLVR